VGVFDFLKKKSVPPGTPKGRAPAAPPVDKKVVGPAKVAGDKRAQTYDRMEALQQLAEMKSPDAAAALLKTNPSPSADVIAAEMTNLCRCGTYPRIGKAIARAVSAARGGVAIDADAAPGRGAHLAPQDPPRAARGRRVRG